MVRLSTPKRSQTGYTLAIKNFSQPRIYTGGIDITLWNELSKEEQNNAISKDWYYIINSKMRQLENQNECLT